jgi:hypothetical protein
MPYCIQCGSFNPDSARFCNHCGNKIISTDVNTSTTPDLQQTPDVQSQTYARAALSRNTYPATTAIKAPGNENFKSPALYGSLLVLIGFFLPWFPNYSGYYNSPTINGTGFVKSFIAAMSQLNNEGANVAGTIFSVLIYLIPICAALFFINALLSAKINGLVRLMRYIPFLVFLLFILLIIIASTSQGSAPVSVDLK